MEFSGCTKQPIDTSSPAFRSLLALCPFLIDQLNTLIHTTTIFRSLLPLSPSLYYAYIFWIDWILESNLLTISPFIVILFAALFKWPTYFYQNVCFSNLLKYLLACILYVFLKISARMVSLLMGSKRRKSNSNQTAALAKVCCSPVVLV